MFLHFYSPEIHKNKLLNLEQMSRLELSIRLREP